MPTSKCPCLGIVGIVVLGNVGIEDIVTKAPFVEQGNGVLLETIDVFVGLHDAKECAQRLVPPVAKRLAEDGRDVVRLALEKQSREMLVLLNWYNFSIGRGRRPCPNPGRLMPRPYLHQAHRRRSWRNIQEALDHWWRL